MNIHEYQAKEILRRFGIPVAPGEVATTAAEAEADAKADGGIITIIIGRLVCGGSWLNPIL